MKKILLFLSTFLISGLIFGQNLVPNPSFETYSACPSTNAYQGMPQLAIGWQKSMNNNIPPSHTDYMNACAAGGNYSAPANIFGTQTAATGNAYMAMTTMAPSLGTDYRENIYIQLTTPLTIGNTYSVSFLASLADNFKFSSNNLGAKFSTVPSFLINNLQDVGSPQITSQIQWTPVSGLIVPDSAYKYIAIGNFHQDINTTQTTVCSSCPQANNLYFIDDVQVILISSTGVTENSKNNSLAIYPNPNKGVFTINLVSDTKLKILNCLGQVVLEKELNSKTSEINMSNFNPGLYFVSLESKGRTETSKIIIE